MIRAGLYGLLGSIGLLSIYFVVMRLGTGSWEYAANQLFALKYWVAPLIVGFGMQIGLFSYLRACNKANNVANRTTLTNTATSSVAMIACCAHHLADILPVIGLSAFALFLARYQAWFLSLGIIGNIIGIFIMVDQIRKMRK